MIREKIVEKIFAIEVLQDLTTLQEACISKPGLFVVEPLENSVYYIRAMREVILNPPTYLLWALKTIVQSALYYKDCMPSHTNKALEASNFFAEFTRLYSIIEEIHSMLEENSD